jgi:GTPase SAR1 family protein
MGKTTSKLNHSRWFGKNNRRIICLGLKGSGKSTLTSLLVGKYPRAAKPLPEIGCYKFKVSKLTVAFYDLKGDEQSRFFWRHHFEGSQGVIFIFDLSDGSTLEQARTALKDLMGDVLLKDLPFLVLGNKVDLTPWNKSNFLNFLEISSPCKHEVVLTSLITGEGASEGFEWLLQEMSAVS